MAGVTLIAFEGHAPQVHSTAFVAPGSRLIGRVEIGAEASIWYNCVLRGDVNQIRIGARTNVQDGTVIHCDSPQPGREQGWPTLIGADVLIGHMAMVHGCILHDRAFVGLGAIVMNDCEIEGDAMLAAGAMLTPGRKILSGQLWAGRPAKYVRDLRPEEIADMRAGIAHYVGNARRHAAALEG
ncbi:gamma carbonic anhydrase family protein [Sphingosinicella terrae]|uniref:gamma carbonic anhydrase family protein n=1 Tax=Sphingosinicella terrae TaxID=2172047 RepID=UPI000E0DEB43|nr:gamma carbonic anhydrase family protein [Sphingosinicella terrae]